MSDIFKKTYTVAEPGCGLTVFSMEGSEINLFGSYTLISTSAEDFFEPIKDFLHEKFVEEKADTMYHIGVGVAAVLGVLAGVAIGVAVCATFGAALGVAVVAGDTALKFLEAGFMLAGASLFVNNYTSNTLAYDKALGYDRSWPEFAGDMLGKIDEGAVAGSLVYAASYKLAAILAGIFMSGGPPLAGVTAAGEIAAGAVEVTTEGEMVIGLSDAVALVAAAIMPGKGGESKEGVDFKGKEDVSVEDLVDQVSDEYKQYFKCKEFANELEGLLKENGIHGEKIELVCDKTDLIYSDRYGLISINKFHQGIKVGDVVYDNLSTGGINYNEWLKDLGYFQQPKGTFKIPEVLESW